MARDDPEGQALRRGISPDLDKIASGSDCGDELSRRSSERRDFARTPTGSRACPRKGPRLSSSAPRRRVRLQRDGRDPGRPR